MPRIQTSRCAILLLAIASLAWLGSCGGGGGTRPNVIVIVMDTLRADRLGCYGYERPTSPAIDAFAAEATHYRRAFATAPWTVPTHGSLFTGKLPFEHGAHTRKHDDGGVGVLPLPESHLTLAEVFRDQGYATGAFVTNDGYLSEHWQFDQGFETYHVERVYADVINRRVVSWLESHGADPFFLYVNYIDTHRVYNARPRDDFLDPPAVFDQGQLLDQLYRAVMPADGPVPAALARKVNDQYDTAVRNLDEQIGLLFGYLKEEGLWDDTVIVLTTDHGEYLGEHHLVEHSKDVYEEAVRAALMVKRPGQRAGSRVEEPVSLADVPALVFDEFPPSFASEARGEFPRDPESDPIIAENYYTRQKDFADPRWGHRFDRVRTVLYEWPWKYIRSSDGAHELYRLDTDPGEQENLLDREAARAEAMDARLVEFQRSRGRWSGDTGAPPLSAEDRKRLRSLGYVD
jgi:arylsulfatase A-like enzyme